MKQVRQLAIDTVRDSGEREATQAIEIGSKQTLFTPQRKAWSSLTITPRTEGPTSAVAKPRTAGKGKAVAFVDDPPPPPPPAFLSETETEVGVADLDTEGVEDWRRFREAGLLDEAAMERKDQVALLERVAKVEREYF